MLPWTFCVSLVAASIGSAIAFPQNSFEADGFVFDGPADRGPTRTRPGFTTTGPPRTTAEIPSRVTTQSTAQSTAQSTTTSLPEVQLNACIGNCPVTPEYNPVCGSDNVNYDNLGNLNCASLCGKAVTLNYYGKCSTSGFRG